MHPCDALDSCRNALFLNENGRVDRKRNKDASFLKFDNLGAFKNSTGINSFRKLCFYLLANIEKEGMNSPIWIAFSARVCLWLPVLETEGWKGQLWQHGADMDF